MFKKIWQKINGKKTISGLGITVLGLVMTNIPFTAPAASYFISTGLGVLGVGGSHKVKKYIDKKKEQKDGSGKS